MPVHVSSYEGGIDRDSSKNKYPKGSYYKMKNFRLISFNELSNGAISSVKGNKEITITGGTGYDDHFVIGDVVIRNWLIVWTTNNITTGGKGTIWRVDLSALSPIWEVVYESNTMNLTIQHPIFEEAIGYYEDSNIIKVYWTDYYNMLRYINIAGTVPKSISVDQIDILSKVNLEQPVIKNISDGNIYVGKIQYAYQYYNIYGSETVFSPCTPLIHLTKSSERLTGVNMRLYEGSDALDEHGNPNNSGKSVKIEIVNADTNYDMIRVVAILYRNLNQDPDIHIVGEYETVNNLIIIDYGSYTKGTLSLNAFRTLGNHEIYCKTISQKGNKALIGNQTEKFFDIDFDARAYRFSPYSGSSNEAYRTIAPDETNLINGSTTNTNLYFTFTTPVDISALTNDAMGLNSIMNSITLHYTENGPFSESSGDISIISDGKGSNNVTASKGSDNNHITVVITNFPTVAGIDVSKTVTNVTSIISDEHTLQVIGGTWHTATHDVVSFGSTFTNSAISVISYIGTTLTLSVATSDTAYFDGTYDHFHAGYTYCVLRSFNFTYTFTQALSYTKTYINNDITFHRDTASNNPANWLWHLTKNTGNYIPCIGTFDPTNFKSIVLNMSMNYTWTAGGTQAVIRVFNTKTGTTQNILTSDDAWPAKTFIMAGNPVPYNHDCICPYNIDMLAVGGPAIDEVATYASTSDFANNVNSCKYQDNTLTNLGGMGPNVKYEFITHEMHVETAVPATWYYNQPETVTIEDLTGFDSYKNPLIVEKYMNLKRDEVYRWGLVATNSKGQDSFVHWIGDIKTPTVSELSIGVVNIDTSCSAFAIGIKFTINTASLVTQDVVSIRIVRVERMKDDRTIYGQGVISHMFWDHSGSGSDPYNGLVTGFPYVTVKTPSVWMDTLYTKLTKSAQFICPEINYFKDLSPGSTHYIKMVSKFRKIAQAALYTGSSGIDVYGATIGLTSQLTYNIVEGTLAGVVEFGAEDANKIIFATSAIPFLNRSVNFSSSTHVPDQQGPSGTCAILILDDDVDISELVSVDEKEIFLVDYKIPGIAESQYGGLTYQSRQGNKYIECGEPFIITGGSDVLNIYGGDTFIDFHEHLRSIWEVDDNNGDTVVDIIAAKRTFNITTFLCESVINTGLTQGFKYSKYYTNALAVGLREDAGTWDADPGDHTIPNHDYDLIQDKDMYIYNSVYSQANITKLYFCKPLQWLSIVTDDTTVAISLEKVSREISDSYLKFLTDNKKTLPTQFGPINDLFLFKNYMMVFFDHAFGTLSIDERAVLPIQNNSLLELGSANNLQFFDFVSDVSGSIHPSSINRIGTGFGWYDAYNGSFGFYNGETQDLGFVKGLSSHIHAYSDNLKISGGSYYNNQLAGGNFILFENRHYKEAICGMIISGVITYINKDSSYVYFSSDNLPACVSTGNDLLISQVVINGVELYAYISGNAGVGTIIIGVTDNPTLTPGDYLAGNYFIYYKDLSTAFAFSNVTGSFQHELEIFPQWLIQYNEDLFEVFYGKDIYKENEGDYGYFYNKYRIGELELFINPKESIVCIFNNFDFTMEVFDSSNKNMVGETWNSLQEYNDYQYSVDGGTDCVCQNAGDVIIKTSHGLILNTRVMFSGDGLPAEIDPAVLYWIINVSTNTFQIALTRGGIAVVFNSDGVPIAKVDDITLSGTDGTATISINGLSKIATWNTSLAQTAVDFVTTNAAAYAVTPYNIILTAPGGGVIRATSSVAGQDFYYDTIITNLTFTLSGSLVHTVANVTSPKYHVIDVPLVISTLESEGNIRRRMRVWHIKDLRDWRTDKPRMRDTYIRLLFKYLHASSKHIIMHDLYTYYSITKESMVNH